MVTLYLNADVGQICDKKLWKMYSSKEMSVSTQALLRYNLFDQLANAIGYPQTMTRDMMSPRSGITVPGKLKQVRIADHLLTAYGSFFLPDFAKYGGLDKSHPKTSKNYFGSRAAIIRLNHRSFHICQHTCLEHVVINPRFSPQSGKQPSNHFG